MSRASRIVVPGFAHHVTQRGNRKADLFETDGDRLAYLRFLRTYAVKHDLAVWAYCLMTNHIHLIVVPKRSNSLSLALHDAHTVYAMHFNERTGLVGHLWQGRFYSCPLDEEHLWAAVRYVERNPARAGLVENAWDYRWSSAAAHCSLREDAILSGAFPRAGVIDDWQQWLSEADDGDAADVLRQKTRSGRPCGSATFTDQLEQLLGREIHLKRRGPKPRKPA